MPTLDWIGKSAVVEHHRQVPFRLLKQIPQLSAGDPDSDNLIIEGDNLEALKALLPYYAGQVKCTYIDPPYNTGNENWVYNDNVNSPKIREWLGKVVGSEGEDLSRHDKWLCMMYPRLVLLWQMLRDDGVIFISIDDHEFTYLRGLMDAIFKPKNFVAVIIWQKRYAASNDSTGIPAMHDYILVYSKSEAFTRNLLPRTEKQDKAYKNPDNDPRGVWKAADYTSNKTRSERPNLYYPLVHPVTGEEIWPKATRVWGYGKEVYEEHVKENRLWWGRNGRNKVPAFKKFLSEVQQGIVPVTWWPNDEVGHTDEAKKEVLQVLQALPGYITPKPTRLIKRILQIATNPGDLVLDSFAGSGTTGHALLKMNQDPASRRRFILVELESNIARDIAAERLRRVINGYTYKDQRGNEKHEVGLGGGFRYCALGPTLFEANGRIRAEVTFGELARHVFFAETGTPLPKCANGKTPLLGVHNGAAVYLLYNGILKDKSPNSGNALTRSVLASLPPHTGLRIIYGTSCRIGDQNLRQWGIIFKQIPYAIKTE